MAGGAEGESLEDTPTYAVAIAASFFILCSLLVERGIHRLKKYLKHKDQKPLRKVLDKLTDELMLLGFISLLLTVLQSPITKICVSESFAVHMLPCKRPALESKAAAPGSETSPSVHRRLLNFISEVTEGPRRHLMAGGGGGSYCQNKGKFPFISSEGLHQLHIFIFVLAITHVGYSLLTVVLGFARLHHWQRWEQETRAANYCCKKELEDRYCSKFAHGNAHGKGFIDKHSHPCYENPFTLWIVCFFQQFSVSVSKEDYLVFRVGFLSTHHLNETFNFRDYVIRSMEVDFRSVIGISWWLWAFVIFFLLINVYGWYTYFWAAFIPTAIVLIIGTKQQHIISTLALQAKRHSLEVLEAQKMAPEVRKKPTHKDIADAVKPTNELFWFDEPKVLLYLIHFVIFQNSFELAIFFWIWASFGWNSCILGNHNLLILRLVVGLLTQLLASYSTLPIYALVTQMGSHMRKTVFSKDVAEGLDKWKANAAANLRKRRAEQNGGPQEPQAAETTIEMTTETAGATEARDSDGSGHSMDKTFQKLYGKSKGLDRIRSHQIRPREG